MAHVPDAIAPLPVPSLHRLDLLPTAVWLLLAVTGRGAAWQRKLAPFCLLIASAALARSLWSTQGMDPGAIACYGAALALSWALIGWRPVPSALARLAPVGAISFGVYAVGFPIQYAIFKAPWLPSGSALTYACRACLLVATTLAIGWVLDRKLQPAVRRAFGIGA
jgi:hypothetical protein